MRMFDPGVEIDINTFSTLFYISSSLLISQDQERYHRMVFDSPGLIHSKLKAKPVSSSFCHQSNMFCYVYFRSYIDVSQMDPSINQMHTGEDPEDKIYWHEDSKPGTIV